MTATAAAGDRERLILPALLALTAVSGIVDAASYLGLGHVFTANMTGNVVILGFSAAGAPGFSAAACLVSLGAFVLGAASAGRLTTAGSRSTWLMTAITCEAVIVAVAAAIALAHHGAVSSGWSRFVVIALLGYAMGTRNSVVRRLAVADVTTTVLTMTLTGLAADTAAGGGRSPRAGRRIGAVVMMFAGGLVGAFLYLHHGTGWALVGAAAVSIATAAFLATGRPRGGGPSEPRP